MARVTALGDASTRQHPIIQAAWDPKPLGKQLNGLPNSPLGASIAVYVAPAGTWYPSVYSLKWWISASIELYTAKQSINQMSSTDIA
jgi:hypothetical protein